MSLCMIRTGFALAMCVSVLACSAAVEESQKPPAPKATGGNASGGQAPSAGATSTGGTGSGIGGSGTSTGGVAQGGMPAGGGTGGTGTQVKVCGTPQGAEAPLPLAVTPNFIPSGYFGDQTTADKGITFAACSDRPAEHTIGECSKWTFKAASVILGEGGYGGVFWQYGANNWGEAVGMKVAPGATKVTFKAWSASAEGGELVEFSAGGINEPINPCHDTVLLGPSGATQVTLTTTPTEYSVDLQGATYPSGIIGGFVWTVKVATVDELVSFYVDEIQWEK